MSKETFSPWNEPLHCAYARRGAVRVSLRSPPSQLLNRGGRALLGSAKTRVRRCLFGITPEWKPASPCTRSFCYLDQVARVRSIRRAAEDLPAERGLDAPTKRCRDEY